mgnify:CR=1 FL=1
MRLLHTPRSQSLPPLHFLLTAHLVGHTPPQSTSVSTPKSSTLLTHWVAESPQLSTLRVLTARGEYLIRTPLKELLPQLDATLFWQIHRGTVVRASAIDVVTRDEAGKLWLRLRGRPEKLSVSRLYAHLFKAM